MRISETLRQLRTADKGLSADQIIDIDFLTEFPIVDDPELKKPMLFYCPSGEWHHVSGIVGKRYRQALQTSDILDDDLGTCRQQIKLFENAYFKEDRTSVLDDPRLGRIPLINFLRYYAYWLFVASKSSGRHFSYEMVIDDFRIHLDSVLDQYENVLKYLDKKLVVAAAAKDESQVFECIELFQKLVAIPTAVLDKPMREAIAKILEESAKIESEIDNRIENELPSAIATLVKAIEDFPNVESHEIPSTYDWINVSRIETVHSEMVTEYVRVVQAFQSLDNLILDKQSGNLRVSSDKYFDAAFNATLARDVVAHISMTEANATNKSETGPLFPRDMTSWEPDALLPELRKFVSELTFRDSVSHQIALVHLFLPFYVANLQTNQSGLVRTEFVKAARVMTSCLAALPDFNAEKMQSLIVRFETTWRDWDSPIGIAYCLLDNAGMEPLRGSTHDAVRLLTTHCGNGRETMHDYLGRSRLQQLFTESARKLNAVAHNDFAREHYEKHGFISTECATRPLFENMADKTTAIVHLSHVDEEWKYGTTDYIVGKSVSTSWNRDHKHDYEELKKDKKRWNSALSVVRREAEEMWARLDEDGGVDLIDDLAELGLTRDIKGVLISRWIQIGLEANETERDDRMDLLGWRVDRKPNWTDPSKRWNAYYGYFSGCGFLMNKNSLILPKSFLWPEERKWYLEHRKIK